MGITQPHYHSQPCMDMPKSSQNSVEIPPIKWTGFLLVFFNQLMFSISHIGNKMRHLVEYFIIFFLVFFFTKKIVEKRSIVICC